MKYIARRYLTNLVCFVGGERSFARIEVKEGCGIGNSQQLDKTQKHSTEGAMQHELQRGTSNRREGGD